MCPEAVLVLNALLMGVSVEHSLKCLLCRVWLKYSFTCGTGRAITSIHRLFSTINIFIQHCFQCVSQQIAFVSDAALLVAITQLLAVMLGLHFKHG